MSLNYFTFGTELFMKLSCNNTPNSMETNMTFYRKTQLPAVSQKTDKNT